MFAQKRCRPFGDRVKIHCDDSVAFLEKFNRPIDVLYCDSLDSYEPGFAQHALNEIVAAMPFLHESSLVVFDDSPTINGSIAGKGTLAVPWLLDRGWEILFAGYQVILANSRRQPAAQEFPSNLAIECVSCNQPFGRKVGLVHFFSS